MTSAAWFGAMLGTVLGAISIAIAMLDASVQVCFWASFLAVNVWTILFVSIAGRPRSHDVTPDLPAARALRRDRERPRDMS